MATNNNGCIYWQKPTLDWKSLWKLQVVEKIQMDMKEKQVTETFS